MRPAAKPSWRHEFHCIRVRISHAAARDAGLFDAATRDRLGVQITTRLYSEIEILGSWASMSKLAALLEGLGSSYCRVNAQRIRGKLPTALGGPRKR